MIFFKSVNIWHSVCVCVCVCLSGVPLSAFICQFVCLDWRNKDIYSYKQERGCLVHLVRSANTLLKDCQVRGHAEYKPRFTTFT